MLPASLDDVVFTNPDEQRHIKRIVAGEVPFPSHAKSGLLLYGRYGTGKTTFVHMIAALLEYRHADEADKRAYDWCYQYRSTDVSVTPQNRGKQTATPASFTLINCGKHHSNSSTSVVQQITSISNNSLNIGYVSGSLNHFVLDELDCWSEAAQANLKGLITDSPSWNVFYITTNRIHKIDAGIVSRIIKVEMNGGEPSEHLKILRKHYKHLSNYRDGQLLRVVAASDGDWREMQDAASRLQ